MRSNSNPDGGALILGRIQQVYINVVTEEWKLSTLGDLYKTTVHYTDYHFSQFKAKCTGSLTAGQGLDIFCSAW